MPEKKDGSDPSSNSQFSRRSDSEKAQALEDALNFVQNFQRVPLTEQGSGSEVVPGAMELGTADFVVNNKLRDYLRQSDRYLSSSDVQEILRYVDSLKIESGNILALARAESGTLPVIPIGLIFKPDPQILDGVIRNRVATIAQSENKDDPETIIANTVFGPDRTFTFDPGQALTYDSRSDFGDDSMMPETLVFANTSGSTPEGLAVTFSGAVYVIDKILGQLSDGSKKILLPVINDLTLVEYLTAVSTAIVRRKNILKTINAQRRSAGQRELPVPDFNNVTIVAELNSKFIDQSRKAVSATLVENLDTLRFTGSQRAPITNLDDDIDQFPGPRAVLPTDIEDAETFEGPQGSESNRVIRDIASGLVNTTLREYLTRLDRGLSPSDKEEILEVLEELNIQVDDILRLGRELPGSVVVVPIGNSLESSPASFDGILRARIAQIAVDQTEGQPEEILKDPRRFPSRPLLNAGQVVLFNAKDEYRRSPTLPDKLAYACTRVNTPEGKAFTFEGGVFLINQILDQLKDESGKILLPIINSTNPTEYLLAVATAIVRRKNDIRRINNFRREVNLTQLAELDMDNILFVSDVGSDVVYNSRSELISALRVAIETDRILSQDIDDEVLPSSSLKTSTNFPSGGTFASNSAPESPRSIRRTPNPPPEPVERVLPDVRRPRPEPLATQPVTPERVFVPRPRLGVSPDIEAAAQKERAIQSEINQEAALAVQVLETYLLDPKNELTPKDNDEIIGLLEEIDIQFGDITKVYGAEPSNGERRVVVVPVSDQLGATFPQVDSQSTRRLMITTANNSRLQSPEGIIVQELSSIGESLVLDSGQVVLINTTLAYPVNNPFPDVLAFACVTKPTVEGPARGFSSTAAVVDRVISQLEKESAVITFPTFNKDLPQAQFLAAFIAGLLRSAKRIDASQTDIALEDVKLFAREEERERLTLVKAALVDALRKKKSART